MAVTIDALELKITHESEGAVKALDTLIETLNKLKDAAGMGGDLATVANGIKAMVKAASSVPARTPIEKVMKNITESAKEATEAVQEAQETIAEVPFQDYVSNSKSEAPDNRTFTDTTNSSYWDEQRAQEASIQAFIAEVDRLSEEMDLSKKRGKAFSDTFSEIMRQAGEAAEQTASSLSRASDEMEDFAPEDIADDVDDVEEDFEEFENELEDVEDELDELGDELDETSDDMDEMGDELDDLEDDMDDADEEIEEHESLISRLGHSYRNSRSGLDKFLQTVKRLVVMRAIRAAIREVAKGFSEGLENLYHYSEAMNSMDSASAKNSLDSVSTALLWMKNSVGAAVAPLIQSLVPVLQTVVTWAVQAANAINMFISTLQGKTTYTKATEKATDMFDSIKSSAGGASKAAKEARATLLAFDEVNRLDAPDKGSGGGGGGGGGLSAKDYLDMFDEAAIELPEWMQWIIDNMDDLLSMVKDVGLGLAAWIITTETINGISKVVSMLQSMTGLQKVLAGGILLAIGVKWAFEGGKAIGEGTAGVLDYIKTGLGIVAAGIGGAFIGSAIMPGIGTGVGFALGITVGIIATLIGVFEGNHERLVKEFYESDIGKSFKAHYDRGMLALEEAAELKLKIDSITAEVDAKTMGKLEKAKDLINEIFDLDDKDNKTAQEMAVLKEKINELNALNLDGIQLEFDETTGKVNGNRKEVLALLEDLKREYKLEAARNALQSVWEAEYQMKIDLEIAQQELNGAIEDYNKLEAQLAPYQKAVNDAQQKRLELEEKYKNLTPQLRYEQEDYMAALVAEQQASDALARKEGELAVARQEASHKVAELSGAVADAEEAYKDATFTAKNFEDAVYGLAEAEDTAAKSQKAAGETSLQYSKNVTDTYKEIQESAQKAAKAVGGINDQDMSNVHKQLQTVKKDLEALAKKYTVKFEYPKGVTGATGYYGQGTMRAAGGYPSVGELFIANEAGPELIGTVNGRTAVAPNAEITGIANAVYTMGEREIAAINNLTRALNAKDMTAVVTADSIVAGLARKNRRDGVSTVPVSI